LQQLAGEFDKSCHNRIAVGPEDHFHVGRWRGLTEGTIDDASSRKVANALRHQRHTQTAGDKTCQRICLDHLLAYAWDESRLDTAVAKVLSKGRILETKKHVVVIAQIGKTQAIAPG